MSNLIVKTIGYLMIIGVLGGPLFGLYSVSHETIEFQQYSGRETGVVIKCYSKRISGSSARYKKVPIVMRPDGDLIYGQVDEIRFFYECEDQINKEVELIYDENNYKRVKINTFLEMWFLPLVLGLVCLILFPSFYFGYKKKLKNVKKA